MQINKMLRLKTVVLKSSNMQQAQPTQIQKEIAKGKQEQTAVPADSTTKLSLLSAHLV
jgi:hypothetical protein